MLKDFNMLITTSRGSEDEACSEVWYLLGEIGDREVEVDKTGVSGLIAAKTSLNPFEAIKKLRETLKERPWDFRFTIRFIPIERVVQTNLKQIEKVSTELSSKIRENESFRITVEKRFTNISSREIIEAVAANINRKVDLTNPDKIVLIEIVGGLTGISVIEPSDILSVTKEKK